MLHSELAAGLHDTGLLSQLCALPKPGQVVRVYQSVKALPQQLAGRIPEQPRGIRRHVGERGLLIHGEYELARVLHETPETRLAFLQPALDLLAPRHVRERHQRSGSAPRCHGSMLQTTHTVSPELARQPQLAVSHATALPQLGEDDARSAAAS
jgi:hypothetical protein